MVNIQIDTLFKDLKSGALTSLGKVTIQSATASLRLNPEALVAANPALRGKVINGFHASIDCAKAMLFVEGFKYFTITTFINREPTIALFHVSGATDYFQLSNLQIRTLDVNESNTLLTNCTVEDMNIGFGTVHQLQKEKREGVKLEPLKTDVRDSRVEKARIFVPHAMLHIKRSNLERLTLEHDAGRVDQMDVRDHSVVERLILSGSVGKLKFRTSRISDLEFLPEARVSELEVSGSSVYHTHNCHPETIEKKSIDSWKLVMDYAQQENNATLYAKAGYQYMKFERKALRGWFSKLAYWFIEISCGYGFRPLRTVFCSILVCILFAGGFAYLTLDWQEGIRIGDTKSMGLVDVFGYSMYFSVVTFTTLGYGDISPAGAVARALACSESFFGLLLSSLFVFALTKRYGGLR